MVVYGHQTTPQALKPFRMGDSPTFRGNISPIDNDSGLPTSRSNLWERLLNSLET